MVDTTLFGRLKRLFSTDVIIRNVGGNQVKVVDSDHIQANPAINTNMNSGRYQRIYTGGLGTYIGNAPYSNFNVIRPQLYNDYEVMDGDPIIASVLDIVADETTLKNGSGEVLSIKSSDENIQRILYNLFYDVLNIEFNLWSWVRSMCKYGDFYLHLHIAEGMGVYQVVPLDVYNVVREEGLTPEKPSYVRFRVEPNGAYSGMSTQLTTNVDNILENYEVANFRLLSDYNFLPNGRSFIEPARKIFKQLTMTEDSMLIHRILRAPQRRIYYVDVGNIPSNEVENYVQKIKNSTKRTPYTDPNTGEYNLRYNMMSVNEDFYIPTRGGQSGTKIDTLPGLEFNAIEDVVYLRDKMLSALKVPKAFLGYEADVEGKCIDLDTLIPLTTGETITARQIIYDFDKGIEHSVFSVDVNTDEVVECRIEWAGITRKQTETVKVYINEEDYIRSTPDHRFLLKNKTWKKAEDLNIGDILYSINKSKDYIVSNIEVCEDFIDTCDITVSKYHNFLTNAGVIIHNSTLAQQDIRFARTIERIQRIVVSELTKIALIHLYSQGYKDENLVNFELELTTPSIIYEQERVALMKEKIDLSKQMIESQMFSTDYVYDQIFHLSEDKYDDIRDSILEDKKRLFRLSQVENEGNDPVISGTSYGTPHDLATSYGKGRNGMGDTSIEGYDETNPVGRPLEKTSIYGTQKRAIGKDPLGKTTDIVPDKTYDKKVISERGKDYIRQNASLIESMKSKINIFNKNEQKSLLDESNILNLN